MIPPKKILLLLSLCALLIAGRAFCQDENAARVSRAREELEKKDYDAAESDLDGAVIRYETLERNDGKSADLDKKFAEAYREWGAVYEAQGKYSEAMERFGRAMRRTPDDVQNYLEAARMSYRTGDMTHALRYTTWAIHLKPDLAEAYALRGSAKLRELRLYDAWFIQGRGEVAGWEGLVGIKEVPEVKVDHVDMDGALDDLTKAVTLKPGYAEAHDCRGLVRYFKGDKKGAIADFDKAIAAQGDYATAWSNRAHAKLATGDAKGAMADFDKAVALQPGFAVAYGNRAAAKLYDGDPDGAMADIGKAISLKADYEAAYDFRGILKQVKGDAAGAAVDYREALQLRADGGAVISNLSIRYDDPELVKQTAGDVDGALSGLGDAPVPATQDGKLDAQFADAYFARAKLPGDVDDGLPDLDRAIMLKPDFTEAYRARGLMRQQRGYIVNDRGRYGGEETDPFRDIPRNPAVDGPESYKQKRARDHDLALADLAKADVLSKGGDAETFAALAAIKREKGDGAGALADVNKAMGFKPDDPALYEERASIKKLLGDEKGAQADIMQALDLTVKQQNGSAGSYYARANEKKARGDTAGALEDFANSIKALPHGYSPAYYGTARINYDHGKMESVMDDLNKALACDPKNADAYYLRAVIRRDHGDADGALADFRLTFTNRQNDHDALREMALIEHANGGGEDALEHLTQALDFQLNPALMNAENQGSEYKAQEKLFLDGFQSDMDKAALKGTNLENVLNRVATEYTWFEDRLPEQYTALIALRPGMGALHYLRAHVYFEQHSLPLALADFRKIVELGNVPQPSLDEAHFLIWVIRAQSGEEKAATQELQAWLKNRKGSPLDDLHALIGRLLTGAVNEEDFHKAAGLKLADEGMPDKRSSEAYFYAGVKRLAAGDKIMAANYFNKSTQTGSQWSVQNWAATAELAMLKPAAQ